MADERKVRVFISSTFRDMHAERDHLVSVVFPELRERCERLGLEFFDVDLRWGVPDKNVDGETANSWEYCRKWIDEAKPFFLCLLGQRYGWVPEPHELMDAADQEAQAEERRSITDMEVRRALEHEAHSRRCFFYLRQSTAPEDASEYVDPPDLLVKLDALKARVRICGRPVWDYPCEWKEDRFTGMEAFGQRVLDDLWSAILRDPRYVGKEVWQEVLGGANPDADPRYQDETRPVPEDLSETLVLLAKPPPKDPLEAEREQMAIFAASRLRWFQGRTDELKDLLQFISDPAQEETPRLAVIAAQPGQGKSALMAKLAQSLTSPALPVSPSPSLFVVSHFVGATEKSSSAYNFVKRLNDELDASGITFPERPVPEGTTREEVKFDFNSLCERLSERLGDYAGERRIVILLDALNQIDDGHGLAWLPYRLGPGVRLVVSCIEDAASPEESAERKVMAALGSRRPSPLRIPLGGLSDQDVRTIVTSHLEEYCKQLDPEHVAAICDEERLPQARNPLYLLVMLAELRSLGGNDMNRFVPELIAGMATRYPDTVSLFDWMLRRMEEAEGFGREAVEAWCRYLALGRVGMASRELADLLKRKFQCHEAARTAQRIERGLRRYSQRRGETLDFFHGQLREAVMGRYGGKVEDIQQAHREIAEYFFDIANPNREGPWRVEERHALSELPHHQIQAGPETWPKLITTLETLFFLEAKTVAGMAFGLVEDFTAAVAALPPKHTGWERLRLLAEALRRDIHFIARHAEDYPQGLFQCLWNSCWWYDCPEVECHHEKPEDRRIRTLIKSLMNWLGSLLIRRHRGVKIDASLPIVKGLSSLVENWRSEREATYPGYSWLRTLRPPSVPLGAGQFAVLLGHSSSVNSVAFSPDGSCILSGSNDMTVRLWDARNGREINCMRGHSNSVTSVAYSKSGNFVISGSMDMTIRIWSARTGKELRLICDRERLDMLKERAKQISDKSRELTPKFGWQPKTFDPAISDPRGGITSVAFSPDDGLILSGSDDGTIRIWDANSGNETSVLRGHTDSVTCVNFSPDGSHVVSASRDKTVRLWDAITWREVSIIHGHTDSVSSVAFSASGHFVISGSNDKTVRLWDVHNDFKSIALIEHEHIVTSVASSPDGFHILSASGKKARLWDIKNERDAAVIMLNSGFVSAVKFSTDSQFIIIGSSDNSVRVFDVKDSKNAMALHCDHEASIEAAAFSPYNHCLASGCWDGTIRVWDSNYRQELIVLRGHKAVVTCVTFSLDGRYLLSGSFDNTVRLWDLNERDELAVFRGHTGGVTSVAFSPDGSRLVSGSNDQSVRIWDVKSGETLVLGGNATLKSVFANYFYLTTGHNFPVLSVAFSPDGCTVISGSEDKTVRLWDALSGQELAVFFGHSGWVTTVAFSQENGQPLSSSSDGTTRLWDLRSGTCLEIREGIGDAAILADSNTAFPWRVLLRDCESVIEPSTGGPPAARFPDALSHIATHPEGRLWAGGIGNHLVVLKLEGGT